MNELKEVAVRLFLREGSNTLYSDSPINSAHEAIDVMHNVLKDMDREVVAVVNLDSKNRPINYSIVSIGALNYSCVYVPNVFKAAILSNADSIILLHNHPSGDVTPSKEDLSITEMLVKASKVIQIKIVDHIIIGAGNPVEYSIYESHPEIFS